MFPLSYIRLLKRGGFYSANDFMRCAKEKSLLTRAEPARLYLDCAQEALETIKVGNMIPPTSGGSEY